MERKLDTGFQGSPGAALGALLVIAGILFLALQLAPVDFGQLAWPLFIVFGGMALLLIGLLTRSAVNLVIPGSIVTMVGLILSVQNTFSLWASWSYAWALVFPTSVGIGIALMGLARGDRPQVGQGMWMAAVGLSLFAVFALFFEGLLRVSGLALGPAAPIVFPLLIVGLGFALLFASVFQRHRG